MNANADGKVRKARDAMTEGTAGGRTSGEIVGILAHEGRPHICNNEAWK